MQRIGALGADQPIIDRRHERVADDHKREKPQRGALRDRSAPATGHKSSEPPRRRSRSDVAERRARPTAARRPAPAPAPAPRCDPAAVNGNTAATSQTTPNRMSRQIMPTKKNAGGESARSGVTRPSHRDCRATVKARRPKPSQYSDAISRNMLIAPGASGSISHHSQPIDRRLPVGRSSRPWRRRRRSARRASGSPAGTPEW